MIIKGTANPLRQGRVGYDLNGFTIEMGHFAFRETTSDNPFIPHNHEQKELWYIISGTGLLQIGECEESVQGGDLIPIEPWVKHGLRTDSTITWICMG
jgi:mannose-6-phosphate isomerase-like protein (cupin superfamily)